MKNNKEVLWKKVTSDIEVSTLGEVRKYINGIINLVAVKTNNSGYNLVKINHKNKRVDKLVAETFITTNIDTSKLDVKHIDGVLNNDDVDNLEWDIDKADSIPKGLYIKDINKHSLTRYTSMEEASKELNMSVSGLLTYSARSKKFPIHNRYVVILDHIDEDKMFKLAGSTAKPIYVYDHVLGIFNKTNSVRYAGLLTGTPPTNIRHVLSKDKIYYLGGYSYSHDRMLIENIKRIDPKTAYRDRMILWSKPVIIKHKYFLVKEPNGVVKEVPVGIEEVKKIYPNVNISKGIIKSLKRSRLLGVSVLYNGLNIKYDESNIRWNDEIDNVSAKYKLELNKRGLRNNTRIYQVFKNSVGKNVYGIEELAKLINIDKKTAAKYTEELGYSDQLEMISGHKVKRVH